MHVFLNANFYHNRYIYFYHNFYIIIDTAGNIFFKYCDRFSSSLYIDEGQALKISSTEVMIENLKLSEKCCSVILPTRR